MKKLIITLAFLAPMWAFTQDFRVIDWKTNVLNVQLIEADTFKFEAEPVDYNDQGAITREIGNYFIDFSARCFKIIGSDATTITVVDLEHINLAPQSNQIGRVYQSIVDADSMFHSIGGVDISAIDELSRWKDVARNNEHFGRKIKDLEGKDTTGIYHINRHLLDSIDANDTTRWGRYEIDTITLDQRDIVDGQVVVVDSVGILYNTTTATTFTGCTSYIDCEGCTEIRMKVPVLTSTPAWGVLFYDADKNPIAQSGVFRPQKTVAGVDTFIFTKSGVTATSGYVPYGRNSSGNYTPVGIPSNAKYFRTGYWNYANAMGVYGSWKCVLITKRGYFGGGKNRPYQSGMINFSVAVNQSVSNFWDTGATNQEPSSLASSPGVLILPSTYTRDGRPTKLIMFCHGMSKAVSYNFWGEPSADNTNFLAQKERWRAAGFAVFDCNGPSANSGASISAVGCPQSVGAYRQCYQYILDHYNVDPELYVIGGSMGGAVALNYCFSFENVRALALLSPWTSLYYNGWLSGVTTPFVTYYGFSNTSTYEPEKTKGFDPWTRLVKIRNFSFLEYKKHPIKMWLGSLESSSSIYTYGVNYITALRNGNSNAQLRIVSGADHSLVSGGSIIVDNEVITWISKY